MEIFLWQRFTPPCLRPNKTRSSAPDFSENAYAFCPLANKDPPNKEGNFSLFRCAERGADRREQRAVFFYFSNFERFWAETVFPGGIFTEKQRKNPKKALGQGGPPGGASRRIFRPPPLGRGNSRPCLWGAKRPNGGPSAVFGQGAVRQRLPGRRDGHNLKNSLAPSGGRRRKFLKKQEENSLKAVKKSPVFCRKRIGKKGASHQKIHGKRRIESSKNPRKNRG